jgi:hypothetical protein
MGQPAALGELSNAYLAYQEDARQAVSRARRAALDCSDTDTAEGKSGAPSYSRPRSAGGIALRPAVYTPRPELSEPAPAAPQWRPAPGAPVRPVQAAASWCPAPVAHNQALSAYKQALQSGPPPPPQPPPRPHSARNPVQRSTFGAPRPHSARKPAPRPTLVSRRPFSAHERAPAPPPQQPRALDLRSIDESKRHADEAQLRAMLELAAVARRRKLQISEFANAMDVQYVTGAQPEAIIEDARAAGLSLEQMVGAILPTKHDGEELAQILQARLDRIEALLEPTLDPPDYRTPFESYIFAEQRLGLELLDSGARVRIDLVHPDSAAFAKGVPPASYIVSVDGRNTAGLSAAQVQALIQSAPRPVTIRVDASEFRAWAARQSAQHGARQSAWQPAEAGVSTPCTTPCTEMQPSSYPTSTPAHADANRAADEPQGHPLALEKAQGVQGPYRPTSRPASGRAFSRPTKCGGRSLPERPLAPAPVAVEADAVATDEAAPPAVAVSTPAMEALRQMLFSQLQRVMDLFRKLDANGDGKVSVQEFQAVVALIAPRVTAEQPPPAALDASGDGARHGTAVGHSLAGVGAAVVAARTGRTADVPVVTAPTKVPPALAARLARYGWQPAKVLTPCESWHGRFMSPAEVAARSLGGGEDAAAAFGAADVEALFHLLDRDSSGTIDYRELNTMLRQGLRVSLDAKLRVGAAGEIALEAKNRFALRSLPPTSPEPSPRVTTLDKARIDEAFWLIDANEGANPTRHSGLLSRAEVLKALRAQPRVRELLGLPEVICQEDGTRVQFEAVYQRIARRVERHRDKKAIDRSEFFRALVSRHDED